MTVKELIERLEELDQNLEVKTWNNYEIVPIEEATEVDAPDYGLEEDIVLLYQN